MNRLRSGFMLAAEQAHERGGFDWGMLKLLLVGVVVIALPVYWFIHSL